MMRFHHVGYLVKELEGSIAAFEKLGYEIEHMAKYDELRHADIVFLKKDGIRIEVVSPRGKESPIYGLMKHYKNNPYHLCFSTDDINEDIGILRTAGFMVFKDREKAPCLDNQDIVFLMHPDIGMVELCLE